MKSTRDFIKGAWVVACTAATVVWILGCYILLVVLGTLHTIVCRAMSIVDTHARRVVACAEKGDPLMDDHGHPWNPKNAECGKTWGDE